MSFLNIFFHRFCPVLSVVLLQIAYIAINFKPILAQFTISVAPDDARSQRFFDVTSGYRNKTLV